MTLFQDLKLLTNEAIDKNYQAHLDYEKALLAQIALDSKNLDQIISNLYCDWTEKMRKNASEGKEYAFFHISRRKDYFDRVLSPAIEIVKLRLEKDGFRFTRFDKSESHTIPTGKIPKMWYVNLYADIRW